MLLPYSLCSSYTYTRLFNSSSRKASLITCGSATFISFSWMEIGWLVNGNGACNQKSAALNPAHVTIPQPWSELNIHHSVKLRAIALLVVNKRVQVIIG